MGRRTTWFVLLLPLTLCIDREATIVHRKVGGEFVAPLCSNATKQSDTNDFIALVTCRISSERSRGAECRLLYHHEKGFEHGCGSRFRLTTESENQTVFVHVTSLTAEDSGNYTCECSRLSGTKTLQFNITVEENEDSNNNNTNNYPDISVVIISVSCVAVFLIVTAVVLGCCLRRRSQRLDVLQNTESPEAVPYDTFIQRENSLYSAPVQTHI